MEKNFKNFFNLEKQIILEKEKIYSDNLHLNKIGHKLYSEILSDKIIEIIK